MDSAAANNGLNSNGANSRGPAKGGDAGRPAATPFFGDRMQVYPRRVKGTLRRLKWAVLSLCLAAYYLGPWLRWDRGEGRPDQALLVDMVNRRAYFFDIEIWPQEVYYVTGLLILGAVGIFFVNSLFGRLWCGFTCPQTVWTDLFMWAERFVEGDRQARIKLDHEPWSLPKLAKKTVKHLLWLVIAAMTGGAWVMYFNDAPTVVPQIFSGAASLTVYFFLGLFTATTYLLAGWAREQVCTFMCPWPRFQSAMVDEETLAVNYRDWRGEPRGKHRKGEPWEGRGDCVDCRACQAVCPTGIDIRDGPQMECISCGLCIDACNEIMGKVGRPRGLIAFESYANLVAGRTGGKRQRHLLRPRTFVYLLILASVASLMLVKLATREGLDVSVLPDRNPLFIRLGNGDIRNTYTLKVANKSPRARTFRAEVTDLPGAALSVAGIEGVEVKAGEAIPLQVRPDGIGTFRVYVRVPRAAMAGTAAKGGEAPLGFLIREEGGGEEARYRTSFRGPTP